MVALAVSGTHAKEQNGFDISNATIPESEIRSGGPGRDGIPSIDRPKFISARRATFMHADDQVVSVTIGGQTKAYPLRILVWHEIVNDTLDGRPIAVTYCPLCGTAMVFDRRVDGRTLEFGVSGLLYQSDVLMYDRETESLWSQLEMQSVSGRLAGKSLVWLSTQQQTWESWKQQNPNGEALSTDTGSRRDYSRTPYGGYESHDRTMFPVPRHRSELRNKAWVAGIVLDGAASAYTLDGLKSRNVVEDRVGGVQIRIQYDPESDAVRVLRIRDGQALPVVKVYWFAWQAFYPKTRLWRG